MVLLPSQFTFRQCKPITYYKPASVSQNSLPTSYQHIHQMITMSSETTRLQTSCLAHAGYRPGRRGESKCWTKPTSEIVVLQTPLGLRHLHFHQALLLAERRKPILVACVVVLVPPGLAVFSVQLVLHVYVTFFASFLRLAWCLTLAFHFT